MRHLHPNPGIERNLQGQGVCSGRLGSGPERGGKQLGARRHPGCTGPWATAVLTQATCDECLGRGDLPSAAPSSGGVPGSLAPAHHLGDTPGRGHPPRRGSAAPGNGSSQTTTEPRTVEGGTHASDREAMPSGCQGRPLWKESSHWEERAEKAQKSEDAGGQPAPTRPREQRASRFLLVPSPSLLLQRARLTWCARCLSSTVF